MSDGLNYYHSTAKQFTKSSVNWRQLVRIDAKLTKKWVDVNSVCSHKIDVGEEILENDDTNVLHGFLDGEYGKSMLSVEYRPVSYLPSESFSQLGLFAKTDVPKGNVVNGVVGFLAEIQESEIFEGHNDMSIIYSKLKNVQWLMLGPVFFVNASCKANVEYKQTGKIIICVATKEIKSGQELTVFYSKRFFGNFNENCLCLFKSEHGNPWPGDPEPPRKRKKPPPSLISSTPLRTIPPEMEDETSFRAIKRIMLDKMPTRRVLYETAKINDDEEQLVSYDSMFGNLETLSPVKFESTPMEFNFSLPSSDNAEQSLGASI